MFVGRNQHLDDMPSLADGRKCKKCSFKAQPNTAAIRKWKYHAGASKLPGLSGVAVHRGERSRLAFASALTTPAMLKSVQ